MWTFPDESNLNILNKNVLVFSLFISCVNEYLWAHFFLSRPGFIDDSTKEKSRLPLSCLLSVNIWLPVCLYISEYRRVGESVGF